MSFGEDKSSDRIQEIMNESRTADRTKIDKQIFDSKGRMNEVSNLQYRSFREEATSSLGPVSDRLANAIKMVEQNLYNQ